MPDAPPPLPASPDEPLDLKGGFVWFDGLFEGPMTPGLDPRRPSAELGSLGLRWSAIEVEGNRFSMLASDQSRPLKQAEGLDLDAILDILNQTLQAVGRPEACDSTLRCTEVGRSRVRETLFAMSGGRLTRVSRERELRPDDLKRAPHAPPNDSGPTPRQRRLLIAAALTIAGLFIAYQMHLHDLVLGPNADELELEAGRFEDLLDLSVDDGSLGYFVHLERAPNLAQTIAAIEGDRGATSSGRSAAARIVATGDYVYVSLRDEDDELLLEYSVSLRNLLREEVVQESFFLPRRIGAKSIRLEIGSDLGHKNM